MEPVRAPPPAGVNLSVMSTEPPTASVVGALALRANSLPITPAGS
jgi:hypothetical protein